MIFIFHIVILGLINEVTVCCLPPSHILPPIRSMFELSSNPVFNFYPQCLAYISGPPPTSSWTMPQLPICTHTQSLPSLHVIHTSDEPYQNPISSHHIPAQDSQATHQHLENGSTQS